MSIALKSVHGPLSSLTPKATLALPPPDGAALQAVYDAETAYMRVMRAGGASALWYDWVPQRSLSGSRRELARLDNTAGRDLSDFTAEPVAVRGTGGTIVPQGPGTINISVLSAHPDHPGITRAYDAVCAALIEGFAAMGLSTTTGARAGSFCDGAHNILLEGRKLVGTAQRWATGASGSVCLHHCVILSGGAADDLCGRAEALYAHAGIDEHYDRDAHSEVALDRDTLRAAMAAPLARYIEAASAGSL